MKKLDGYVVPVLLSDYVETLEDWEIVEWVSRFEVTSKYMRNGATYAKYDELNRVWGERYPEEQIPILDCMPPLDSELYFISLCNESKKNEAVKE